MLVHVRTVLDHVHGKFILLFTDKKVTEVLDEVTLLIIYLTHF